MVLKFESCRANTISACQVAALVAQTTCHHVITAIWLRDRCEREYSPSYHLPQAVDIEVKYSLPTKVSLSGLEFCLQGVSVIELRNTIDRFALALCSQGLVWAVDDYHPVSFYLPSHHSSTATSDLHFPIHTLPGQASPSFLPS